MKLHIDDIYIYVLQRFISNFVWHLNENVVHSRGVWCRNENIIFDLSIIMV